MDPTTVIIMLATNLIFSGVLYHLIARRLSAGSGLNLWGVGAILFGLAYGVRLTLTAPGVFPLVYITDLMMQISAVLYLLGTRQWLGLATLGVRVIATLSVVYLALLAAVLMHWGEAGRFLLLNVALAVTYGCISISCLRHRGGQDDTVKVPLTLMGALMGGLSGFTLLRGIHIGINGTGVMTQGLPAQVYYGYASLAVVLMELCLLWMVFERLNLKLMDMATRDPLTAVLNRRGLEDALAQHFAARNASPMILLAVDIDHFKRVNDLFGHATGDLVLRAVANVLAVRVRGDDFVARVGGEEFIVGCAGGDPEIALQLGERLRTSVAALQMPMGMPDRSWAQAELPKCTVSVGISLPFTAPLGRSRAMREADAAMYAAKSGGRNRVVPYEETLALSPGTAPVPLSQT